MPEISLSKAIKKSETAASELRNRIDFLKFIRKCTPRARVLDYGNMISVNSTPDGAHWSGFLVGWKGEVVEVICLDAGSENTKARRMLIIDSDDKDIWTNIHELYAGHARRHAELLTVPATPSAAPVPDDL